MAITGVFEFGRFLKQLREEKGVSLVDVEKALGISNAYLSQLETGTRRRLPSPERLRLLADYYNVTVQELLEAAGYLEEKDIEETYEQKIEKSFMHIINDPKLRSGVRIEPKKVSLDVKRFIVEMYGQLFKQAVQLAKPYLQGVARERTKITKLNWKIEDLQREKFTSDGKKFIRYRVKVTCVETEGKTASSRTDDFAKGSEKIVQTVTAEGESQQEVSTLQGFETSLQFKATQDALRKAVPQIKSRIGWSVNHILPWFS